MKNLTPLQSRTCCGVRRLFSFFGLIGLYLGDYKPSIASELVVELAPEKEEVALRTACEISEIVAVAQSDRSMFTAEEDIRSISQHIPAETPNRHRVIEWLVLSHWLKEGSPSEIAEAYHRLKKNFPNRSEVAVARALALLRFYEQEVSILDILKEKEKVSDELWLKLAEFRVIFKSSPDETIEKAEELSHQSGRRIERSRAISYEWIRRYASLSVNDLLKKVNLERASQEQEMRRLLLETLSERRIKFGLDRITNLDSLLSHWISSQAPTVTQTERKMTSMLPDLNKNHVKLMTLNEALLELASDPKTDSCQGASFKVWLLVGQVLD